ncbi:hypothetical protein ACOQFV_09005 [Nocardiopsis changdeensis]|uniref:DUF3077 domain-containing protein n=1 Tax=Nocardiopsis changdeensis TaxID=2831969 RepID=A0ABX8BEY8_9ACTN|nr:MULTISPECIES: hypothetical protein [Nocardiopsis]QUX20320.1 hypothetical protein KGD84_17475 [Nocardiopsis changdeensis]QYX36250.1 hypothetical protein K1J57_26930 [Nocardiopsis sp. MT53]
MTEHDTTPETQMPTFRETVTLAAATLAEARSCAGLQPAPQLVSVADSYMMLAQILDRRERGLE